MRRSRERDRVHLLRMREAAGMRKNLLSGARLTSWTPIPCFAWLS